MKIGLIGYGAMGRLVGGLATQRGHEIALKLDIEGAERGVEDLVRSLLSRPRRGVAGRGAGGVGGVAGERGEASILLSDVGATGMGAGREHVALRSRPGL